MDILESRCVNRPIEDGPPLRGRRGRRWFGNSMKGASSDSDFDYLRMRALKERSAARSARDMRVRRVHLEMAERYEGLFRRAQGQGLAGPHFRFAAEE